MQLTFERKLLRVMRLTSIILLGCCLHVAAKTSSQTITYRGTNVMLETVFSEVEKQTGYVFVYNPNLLERTKPVTVSANQVPLEDFLKNILFRQQLDYVVDDKTITIKPKEIIPTPVVSLLPIAGVVKGVNGKPLANVSVVVKGTEKGTTTNAEGKFSIDVNQGDVLVVSSVGFGSKEVKINAANSSLVIALEISSSPLDEVQVIAYGETSKRLNTGNVSTVKAADIEKQPVNNPLLALQGRVPGLFIEQTTGLPGTGVRVRIQGQNSILYGNDPLYVVDDVPYLPQLLPSLTNILGSSGGIGINGYGANGNPLNFINPADIESIEILKDADATAIYGSRAASGAILITTKKGRSGRTNVHVNFQKGWGKVGQKLDLLNTRQYLEMRHEALRNDNASVQPTDFDINGTWDSTRYTDWQEELIGGTAQYTDIKTSISGGNANTNYLVGAGYHKETTVFPGDLSDRKASLHFNISSISPNEKFRLMLTGNYMDDENNLLGRDITEDALRIAPNAPALYNGDGSLNWAPLSSGVSTWKNPVAYLLNTYSNHTTNLVSNATLSYKILPGLEAKSSFGYNRLQVDEISTGPLLAVLPEERSFTPRSSLFADGAVTSWIIEPQATFGHAFGHHKFEILAGSTFQQTASDRIDLEAKGFNSDLVLKDIRSASNISVRGTTKSLYKYNALFGRVNYNWKDKLILNLTARRDGSSRFGPETSVHSFGAIGAAWILSSEPFMQSYLPQVSFAKVRASYGTTGNDQIGDYRYMSLYTTPFFNVPYQAATGLAPNGLSNPYLEWEETRKLQAGIDLGFFKDALLFNATYFNNRSDNQLLSYDLPAITGFPSIDPYNFPASVENSGWEFSFSGQLFSSGTFEWSSSINATIPRNKLRSFPGIESSAYKNQLVVGEPVIIEKRFRFAGVNPETGVYQFTDGHGNATSNPDPLLDLNVLIKTFPTLYGGFQNKFRYKSFQLDVLFQFVRQKASDYSFGNFPGLFFSMFNLGNQPMTVLDRWQQPGDVKRIQRYNSDFSIFQAASNANSSDGNYADASYLRLKNVSFSWEVPADWTRTIKLRQCRLYINCQNLLTITNYKGLDPESKSTNTLPPLQVMTGGIQVTL